MTKDEEIRNLEGRLKFEAWNFSTSLIKYFMEIQELKQKVLRLENQMLEHNDILSGQVRYVPVVNEPYEYSIADNLTYVNLNLLSIL